MTEALPLVPLSPGPPFFVSDFRELDRKEELALKDAQSDRWTEEKERVRDWALKWHQDHGNDPTSAARLEIIDGIKESSRDGLVDARYVIDVALGIRFKIAGQEGG